MDRGLKEHPLGISSGFRAAFCAVIASVALTWPALADISESDGLAAVAVRGADSLAATVLSPPPGIDGPLVKNLDTMVVATQLFTRYVPSQAVLEAKDFVGKYQDLQSVLETVSGITVRGMGGFGHYAEASIRGSSSNQVQVNLDGMPLNEASGTAVDISKIPLSTLQSITISKGTPSLECFGDNAGGVINLSTDATKNAQVVTLETGSFGYRAGTALFDKRTGSMTHHFSVNYGYADNDYPYVDSMITHGPSVHADDPKKTMDNNFFSRLSSSYAATWQIDERHNLTARVTAQVVREGIFYLPEADSNDGSIKNSRFAFSAAYTAIIDSGCTYTLLAQAKTDEEQFQRRMPFYLYPWPVRYQTNQPGGALEGIVSKKIGRRMVLHGLLKGSYFGYDFRDLYSSPSRPQPHFFRLYGKAGVEAELHAYENLAIRVAGIYRYEIDSTNGKFYYSGFSAGGVRTAQDFPGGFSEITWSPLGGLALETGVRYSSRTPGFTEKFSQGANYTGNSDLRPETRLEYDAGVAYNKPRIAASVSFFASTTKDKIVFTMNAQHMFVPQNMNEVASWGLESDFAYAPRRWISVTNSATYMENTIASPVTGWIGKDEPLLPRFTDEAGIKLFCKKVYVCHSALFESPYFLDPDNTREIIHNRPELNLTVGVVPSRHFDLSYRMENYLDFQNYDFPDRPIPGRRHFFVVNCQF
jgi:outer membrane cobalamin receptor